MSGRSLGLASIGVVVGLLAIGCGGGSGSKGTAGHDGGAGHGGAGAAGGETAGVGGAAGAGGAAAAAGGTAGGGGAVAGAGGADAGSDSGAAGAAVDGGGGNADARDASAADVLQPPADAVLGADAIAADADSGGEDGPFAHGPANLCGSIVSSAPTIQQTITTATYQDTAAGGQITPGVYWMTSETIFMPAVSNQLSDTVYFYGDGTFEEVQLRGGNTSLTGGTWAIVGTTLQMNATCPGAVSINFRITATDSTLTVFYDPNMMVTVYTRK
jgi:hypothetical protein